ncbi:MAG: CDP-glucose 4,6-dehydratase [Candidatus Omnitrophica bacterium]|nr:CDP-glucose 4,6-dehydratase [Candidatus Omnitrophota bacterium]
MTTTSQFSKLFLKTYQGKRVLVTGHTGFKGSWLSMWLLELEAKVAGFSKYVPTKPSAFEAMDLTNRLQDFRGDVRNMEELKAIFKEFRPQIVFHLAAQPLVRDSYQEPRLTFETNVMGTINVLECVRDSSIVEAAVIITSDKCYENVNWEWGYREIDRLGGEDPYSASKACAELAFRTYAHSYFHREKDAWLATTRAGNVIGGGDWAKDRIVPDCVKAWYSREVPVIRKPEATRPWQHVLEPLSGYLWLGALLNHRLPDINGESFNFGPDPDVVKSVEELVEALIAHSGKGRWEYRPPEDNKKEANLLKLNCDKALNRLEWSPVLNFEETVAMTAEWYKKYYAGGADMYDFGHRQIQEYVQKAAAKKLAWAMGKEHDRRSKSRASQEV